ncbi:MAG: asparagine synthetase B family protein [Flavisolibacter sp.]
MCGIAGIVSKNQSLVSTNRIKQGIACLTHRGPESNQTWLNASGSVTLAHSRLSIIDLDERAAQPLHYGDRFTIIHNGELYNYIELKKQLEQKGFRFKTTSDTEVIVAAYAAWGTECLQRFDGMFAFAIWDEKEQKLFAARDRFGEKPFFFFLMNQNLFLLPSLRHYGN